MPERTTSIPEFDLALERLESHLAAQGCDVARVLSGDALDSDPYFRHNTYARLGYRDASGDWVELDPPLWWDQGRLAVRNEPEGQGRGAQHLATYFPDGVRGPDSPTPLVAACLGSPYSSFIFELPSGDLAEILLSRQGILNAYLWAHFGSVYGWLRYGVRPQRSERDWLGTLVGEQDEASRAEIEELFTHLCANDPAVREDFQDAVLSSLLDGGRILTMRNVMEEALRRCPDAPLEPPERFDLNVYHATRFVTADDDAGGTPGAEHVLNGLRIDLNMPHFEDVTWADLGVRGEEEEGW